MRYSVTKKIPFCYGHRLLDYEGKCRHLHGHNGTLEVMVDSDELDRLGMVMDFAELKERVKKWVDEELDHKMILNEADPVASLLREKGETFLTVPCNPTAEAIAKLVFDHCRGAGVPVSAVRLWETDTSSATYRG